jgi:hypothetical protein
MSGLTAKQAEMYGSLLVISALMMELDRYGVDITGVVTTEQSADLIAIATEMSDATTRDQQITDMTRIYTGRIARLIADYKTDESEATVNG